MISIDGVEYTPLNKLNKDHWEIDDVDAHNEQVDATHDAIDDLIHSTLILMDDDFQAEHDQAPLRVELRGVMAQALKEYLNKGDN